MLSGIPIFNLAPEEYVKTILGFIPTLKIQTHTPIVQPYDITPSMIAYLFLCKLATLTQNNSLSPYFHMWISVSQLASNTGIAVSTGIAAFAGIAAFVGLAVFTGIAVFARLRCLKVITRYFV